MKYTLDMHGAYGVMVIGVRESGCERGVTSSRNCGGVFSRLFDGMQAVEYGDLSVQQPGEFQPMMAVNQMVSIRHGEEKIIGRWGSSRDDSQLYVKLITCPD